MLTHPTLDKLHTLRLTGMAKAFEEQLRTPGIEDLSGEERLGLLVDRELAWRETRRLATRSCAMAPASKTSTTATREAWTEGC
jgi:hypothetical protein